MARFCFNTNRKDAKNFLKMFFDRVDVDFEVNQSESCIILKNKRDKDIFIGMSEKLAAVDGFSFPSYVPMWKSIRHRGPYLAQYEKEPFMGSVLIDKTTGKRVNLNPVTEKAAFLFASILDSPMKSQIDSTFIKNYWNDFKQMLDGESFHRFEDIDWHDVVTKFKRRSRIMSSVDRSKFGFVEIDGKILSATPFAADDISLFFGENESDNRRGLIKRAIKASDVTLNVSPDAISNIPNKSEFKEIVYRPGVKWAAKWTVPITGQVKYMDILFSNPTEQEFIENFNDDSDSEASGGYGDDSDDSDNEGEWDYLENGGDDSQSRDRLSVRRSRRDRDRSRSRSRNDDDIERPTTLNLFGDIDDLTDSDDESDDESDDDEINPEKDPEENPEEKLDFSHLDEEESELLPFSYVIPYKTQWEIVLDACRSNFRNVKDLGKVSNEVLKLIADAAGIALSSKTAIMEDVNYAFIEYANRRGV
jgi:hypothetical protein